MRGSPKNSSRSRSTVRRQRRRQAGRDLPARAVVATRDLPFGKILTADDLEVVSIEESARPSESNLSDPDVLIGSALSRAVRAGETLGRADAHTAIVVKRKKIVVASSVFDGGRVSTQLVAQQDGKAGDWIEFENPQSGRKVRPSSSRWFSSAGVADD
jgi:flagella basal body P-ring formation protein FlgA